MQLGYKSWIDHARINRLQFNNNMQISVLQIPFDHFSTGAPAFVIVGHRPFFDHFQQDQYQRGGDRRYFGRVGIAETHRFVVRLVSPMPTPPTDARFSRPPSSPKTESGIYGGQVDDLYAMRYSDFRCHFQSLLCK